MIICGDNIEKLKAFPDNHFDSIVTDSPYGLGKEPNAEEMLKAWLEHGYLEVKGGGFMGRKWDSFVPQPLFWKEAFRVRIACKLEGFEFVGIEQDADSCKIAETRIESWVDELDVMITREIKEAKKDNTQLGLEL
jgi:DNA modification methylase